MDNNYTIPKGANSYCGPAALAYITRTNPDMAAQQFRRASGARSIKGVSTHLMIYVLNSLGMRTVGAVPQSLIRSNRPERYPSRRPTLKQWWLSTDPDGLYLINITGHYIVLDGSRIYDNQFREGKAFHVCPYLNCRVKAAWRIEK